MYAETYPLVTDNVKFNLWTSTGAYEPTGTSDKLYDNNSATNYYGFTQKISLEGYIDNQYNPNILFPGQYLIEFFIYSDNSTISPNPSCSQYKSNFENVNKTTGNWVSNELSSQCVDVYNTTYNGHQAVRILYKFTYKGSDGIDELRFSINSSPNDWFYSGHYGFKYGMSLSNIYDYDSSIISQFSKDKKQQEANQKLDDLKENQNQNTQDVINNQDKNQQETNQKFDELQSNQDKNNEELKDKLDEEFKTCRLSYNLLPYPYRDTNKTSNGITFTVNDNGTITLNGTANSETSFHLAYGIPINNINDYLTFSVDNLTEGLDIGIYDNWSSIGGSWIALRSFRLSQTTTNIVSNISKLYFRIKIPEGTIINNLTIKPMINKGKSVKPYEKYGEQICINKFDEQLNQDKTQHDEIMNSDINDSDKELPDDSGYQDYTNAEDTLKDKINEADMNVISIGIDASSSKWIWETLTSLIQSHTAVFSMVIAILSIGIIKLALGR